MSYYYIYFLVVIRVILNGEINIEPFKDGDLIFRGHCGDNFGYSL